MSRWGIRERLVHKVNSRETREIEIEPEPTTPAVSVVMPVGEIDDRLRRALQHLAAQETELDWELVIALNTPGPQARIWIGNMLRLVDIEARVIDASGVPSSSHARNQGAAAAIAPKLLFCDSDDEVDPGWLQSLATALVPGTAVGGHLDETTLVVVGQENWRPPATPGALPSFLGAEYLASANMAVWADDFAAVGGFDETLVDGEDIDLGWKLTEAGVELRYESSAVVHYRHRTGLRSLLRQHYLYGRGMAQVLARRPPPGDASSGGVRLLVPNGQKVDQLTPIHVLRRGAIAAGRIRGLLDAREFDSAA